MKISSLIIRTWLLGACLSAVALMSVNAHAMGISHDFRQFLHTTNQNRLQHYIFDRSFINIRYSFAFSRELALGPVTPVKNPGEPKHQPLLYNGQEIGRIKYQDTGSYRYISNLDIFDEKHRGKFRGGWYLEQFIHKSRQEGVVEIELYALKERINFYLRLGFVCRHPQSQTMIMVLDPVKRKTAPPPPTSHVPFILHDMPLQPLRNCNNPEIQYALDNYDIDFKQNKLYDDYTNVARRYPLSDYEAELEKKIKNKSIIERGYDEKDTE